MKKPDTYEKLLECINPEDLYEILSFSGRNDKKDQPHAELRKKYSSIIFNSMERIGDRKDWRNPNPFADITPIDEFYDTLIRCIQDFYWWSHQFAHIHASVYKRVMNVLNISIEEDNIVVKT